MDAYPLTDTRDKRGSLARQGPAELEELEYQRVTAEYLARKERGETGPGIPHDEARRRIFGASAGRSSRPAPWSDGPLAGDLRAVPPAAHLRAPP
ncbi:hypothetical protein ACFT9I_37670 [Streptomyces sp. NPDC057137]|uniref:hypothetical protein n=1 Tax=Streptomyces sp. NPDC057137 TaxID=3346030 RepID=UPI00364508DE